MNSKLPSKSVASAAVTQSIRSASKNVQTSTELVWTYIRGSNIEIGEVNATNYPAWFWWVIVAGCMVCCISCMAWVVCAVFFFKREKPCTHTVHVVVDHDAGSPRKPTRSPKKEEIAAGGPSPNDNPPTDGNGSFTNPLTPDYARSSKRSSRKEEEAPKKPEPLPDGAGGSKKSAKSGKSSASRKSSKNGSKKSSKQSSKKSGKSSKNSAEPIDRQDGGKDGEYCIQMDSNDYEMVSEPIKYGFFEKISRSMFNSRDY